MARLPLFALCVALITACGEPDLPKVMNVPDAGSTDDPPPTDPGDGHVVAAVEAALRQAGGLGRTWQRTEGNLIADDWILQSPPEGHWGQPYARLAIPTPCAANDYCHADFKLRFCGEGGCSDGGLCAFLESTVTRPDGPGKSLCIGHSDFLFNEMYRVMIRGKRFVDVASLAPPDERFETALRNAITYLSYTGNAVQVRILFGTITPQPSVDTFKSLMSLTRDMNPSSPMRVSVGAVRASAASWNHAKIVAADGELAIIGGHNLWTLHYLNKDPVHDLSMRVEGPAAAAAQGFANELWSYVCAQKNGVGVRIDSRRGATMGSECPDRFQGPAGARAPGDSTILTLGRLGQIDPALNQADAGLLAMVRAARRVVRISQQDLGPPKKADVPLADWPWALFDELGAAMARGVDVYLVLANLNGVAGGLNAESAGYSNGWSLEAVAGTLFERLVMRPPPGAGDLAAMMCRRFHIAPLRFSEEDTFPDRIPLPNHSKLLMVDDQAFYIGSQNLYVADLAEFGLLVDDARAAYALRRAYFDNLWRWSGRRVLPDGGIGGCSFQME